ncbi:MAG: hypothetical protein OQK76_04040 [Gammaproteobacteria bacterium]|nr:hypothetical protein [Gammaproteobacteria bacterium]
MTVLKVRLSGNCIRLTVPDVVQDLHPCSRSHTNRIAASIILLLSIIVLLPSL